MVVSSHYYRALLISFAVLAAHACGGGNNATDAAVDAKIDAPTCVPIDDLNDCTIDSCSGTTATYANAPIGTACATGTCNGEGVCWCATNDQCTNGQVCDLQQKTCVDPTCDDGQRNGSETDVDCGGSCAPGLRCLDGKSCAVPMDCASGVCQSMVCQVPRCGDAVSQVGEACDDGNDTNGDGCDDGPGDVCKPTGCGNGVVTGAEVCDDGNTINGDGCDNNCTVTACGNGIVVGVEGCDDGNVTAGDGCSTLCVAEPGWTCMMSPSQCMTTCGDGIVAGAEACDDTAPAENGDGCSAACAIETGWRCTGSPSVCGPICGDGLVTGNEACDDAPPAEDADGCSQLCTVEAGYSCAAGSPSVCSIRCGDGVVGAGEQCDDACMLGDPALCDNADNGDGCSAACRFECGNGVLDLNEQCDDANRTPNDGCSASCRFEFTCPAGQTRLQLSATDVPRLIPDNNVNGISSVVEVPALNQGAVVKAAVGIGRLSHPTVGSLSLALIAPSNRSRVLTAQLGGVGDNFVATNVADGNPRLFANTPAPFTGLFAPIQTLSDGAGMLGQNAAGTWQLHVVDNALQDTGAVDAWTLSLCIDTTSTCGNGTVTGTETCDDGNLATGDGCSDTCRVETRYTCTGNPSTCGPACGDGVVFLTEQCDDGNAANGDGCSATCTLELTCAGGETRTIVRSTDAKSIPDTNTAVNSVANVTTNGAVRSAAIVLGNIRHVAATELDISLVSPLGTARELSTDNPSGAAANFSSTGFFDTAATSIVTIVAGQAPFRGAFKPEQSLAISAGVDFRNQPAAGTWALRVADDTAGSAVGSIESWTLGLCIDPNAICGNGVVNAGELCDDGNVANGDGCNASCRTEVGYGCTGMPSACLPACGDGVLLGNEQCDDGNTVNNDGCSATCNVEITCGAGVTPVVLRSFDVPQTIPDFGSGEATSLIPVNTAGAVRKIIVAIGQLNHAATSHLDIKLVSPAGAGRFVATDIPTTGTAANYTSTILNDSAAAAISSVTAANAPFRGAYRPASSLTVTAGIDFLNVPAIGNWALAIADDTAGTSGTLQRWTLAMCIDENSICGNGIVDAGEACDDGNTNFGDGCNASCRIETGYACGGAPSTCNVVCGDSLLVGPERCDDGNQINNDGCSATCNLELTCTGGATPVIFTSTDVAKAIPDLSEVSSVVTVGTLGTVRKAIVAVGSLVHPAVGDLTIDLINPAGQARRLMQTPFLFTPAANLRSTIFNDSAATALASANFTQAPFVGSWKPSATLSTSAAVDFLGQAAPGTWSLRIGDSFLSQSGTLEAWSLGLCIDQNAICGDGIVVAGETCDDGNTVNGDGCTSTCGTEGGYTCVGAPSVCTFGCGAGETLVTVSNTTATTVPDGDSIGLLSPVTVSTAGLVRSVTPALSISHGQVSQLTVSLLSPFGGERQLASGGTGANYSATSFNDGAPRSITGGLAPFSGQFRPLQTISGNPPNGHSNQSAAGIWQLRVRDNSAGTVGTLNSWSLRVCVDTSTPKLCGNGIVEAGESCDDGNAGNGDGCSSTCGIELTCGVGETRVVQRASGMPFNVTPAVSQSPLAIATAGVVRKALVVFDAVASSNGALSSTLIAPSGQRAPLTSFGDSNFAGTMFDDSAATNFTSGATPHTGRWKPATALSTLAGVTANGTWNLEASNYNGALVRGWTLAVCVDAVGRCGDGQLQFGETCDDGNVANGDGCNDACRIDGGYTCVGLPSVCTFACGPGETLVTAANTTALSIPTGDKRGVLSSITLPTTGLIRSVTPTVNVTHGNVAELSLSLLPPYGTARALSKGSGTGANLVNVSFHDASSRLIANASAPIAGQFRPVETLASDGAKDFKGQASGGKWHLRLSTGNTAGLLTGWSLKVCVDTSVPRVCGNGIVEATETCDDGNSTNGDGCASSCQLEFSCGAGETPVLTRSTGGPVLFSDTLASSPVTVAATGTVRKAVVIVDALSADISYDVSLASPANQLAGRLVPVSSRLISTYLDDAAPTRIDFGSSPYRGRFRPFNGSLAPMIGQSAAGVWSLQVRDSGSIPGVLHAWSLGLCVQ